MDIESGVVNELTTESFAQAPTFTPDGRSIVYMTGAGADIFPWQLQGADWWIMNVDGSDKRRLTFMNVAATRESVAASGSPGRSRSSATRRFFGDVMTQSLGLVGKIVKSPAWEARTVGEPTSTELAPPSVWPSFRTGCVPS